MTFNEVKKCEKLIAIRDVSEEILESLLKYRRLFDDEKFKKKEDEWKKMLEIAWKFNIEAMENFNNMID